MHLYKDRRLMTNEASEYLAAVEACNCFAVRAAARRVSQPHDQFLAPTGARTTKFSILAKRKREGPLTATGPGGRQANLVSINSALLAPACSTRPPARARSIYIRHRRAGTPTPRLGARRTSPCRRHREYWACG